MASQCYVDRTDRGGCRLRRRRPDGDRQWPRRGAVRRRGLRSALCTRLSASPNGASSGAAPSSHAAATLIQSPGQCWSSHWRSPGAGDEATGRRERADRRRRSHPQPLRARVRAVTAYGFAFRDADPVRALEALRRGLVIAQDSGNRLIEITAGDRFVSARGRTRRPAGRARLHHSGHPQLLRLRQRRLHPFRPG